MKYYMNPTNILFMPDIPSSLLLFLQHIQTCCIEKGKKILSIQNILWISFDMISVGSILLVQLEQELKKFNITYIPTFRTIIL